MALAFFRRSTGEFLPPGKSVQSSHRHEENPALEVPVYSMWKSLRD